MSGRRSVREPRFDGVLSPIGGVGIPAVRTLCDEYRDVPEPEDSDRVPPPKSPGIVERTIRRLRFRRR